MRNLPAGEGGLKSLGGQGPPGARIPGAGAGFTGLSRSRDASTARSMAEPPLLHHDRLAASDAEPDRWILVLHGIYGAGRNWRSVARGLVERRPEWGAVLVDLRQHGRSTGFPEPHTLEAAAGDLRALVEAEELPARAVLGHSFGGKVAMIYARDTVDAADDAPALEHLWVVDSTPDARRPGGTAWRMLETLRRHPGPFAHRDAAVDAVASDDVPQPVATWMATNLERDEGDAYRWRIDPDDMEALLRESFDTDTWAVVESPPPGLEVHVVKARDSAVLDEEACRRVEAAGEATGRAHLHRLDGGHWLNADNPDALVDLLAREL